jgi:hypothetical protein
MAIAIFATQNIYLVNLRLFSLESVKLPLGLLLIFCMGSGAIFISLWQTTISFQIPAMPKFSILPKQNPQQNSPTNKKSISKKANPKNDQDDFDHNWTDDW